MITLRRFSGSVGSDFTAAAALGIGTFASESEEQLSSSRRQTNDFERQRIDARVVHIQGQHALLNRSLHPHLKLVRGFEQCVIR